MSSNRWFPCRAMLHLVSSVKINNALYGQFELSGFTGHCLTVSTLYLPRWARLLRGDWEVVCPNATNYWRGYSFSISSHHVTALLLQLYGIVRAHEAEIFQFIRNISRDKGDGEIAQSLAYLSTKRAIRVRARLDLLVLERWNSITVLLTFSHQCRQLFQKRLSMCYYVCVMMHVKDP